MLEFRIKLITEEYEELIEAAHDLGRFLDVFGDAKSARGKELVEDFLKEMADLQYVLSGTAVAFGIPLDLITERIHESNMSKLGPGRTPVYRKDGKVLKGTNYKPPFLGDIVDELV